MTSQLFAYLAISLFLFGCKNDRPALSGVLSNITEDQEYIYLLKISSPDEFYLGSNRIVIDSARIDKDGRFSFNNFNELDTSFVYRLNLVSKNDPPGMIVRDYQTNSYAYLLNDSKSLFFTGNTESLYKTYNIESAGTLNYKMKEIRDIELDVFDLTSEYMPQYQEVQNNPEKLNELRGEYVNELMTLVSTDLVPKLREKLKTETDPRIQSLLLNQLNIEDDIGKIIIDIQSAISKNDQNHQNHPYVRWWQNEINKFKTELPVGTKVPNIILKSPEELTKELYDIHSKLILIDFWASWCSPCRKENKEIVKPLYDKYKKDGFEVFGVSFDTDKKKWQNAIASDGISWTQVSDLKGKESKVWKDYYLEQLPTTFLINSEFEVVAKNLRGENLKLSIEDYFN